MADQQEIMLQKLQDQHKQLEEMLKSHEDKMAAHKAASDSRRNGAVDKVHRRPQTSSRYFYSMLVLKGG